MSKRVILGVALAFLLAACGDKPAPVAQPVGAPATAIAGTPQAADTPTAGNGAEPASPQTQPAPTPVLPTATPEPPLAAMVNQEPILLSAYEEELARYEQGQTDLGLTPGADGTDYRALVLNNLIEQTLIAQAAAAAGLSVTPEMVAAKMAELKQLVGNDADFQAWLQANQWTEESFAQALSQEMLTGQMMSRVTEAVPYTSPQVHARYLHVADQATAQLIVEQLQNGADFGQMARQYSLDRLTGENGGDLGFFGRHTLLVPEVEEAAFALEPNATSPLITVTAADGSQSYYLVQLLERDEAHPLTPEQRSLLLRDAFEAWLAKLWSEAQITRLVGNG